MIDDRHIEPDGFSRQRLHHEARGARAAARCAAYLVMVGLIAQHAAQAILRDRQSHELQGAIARATIPRLRCRPYPRSSRRPRRAPRPWLDSRRPPRAVGGMQGLLVGAGAGGRAAKGALGRDGDVEVPPLHLDRGPQSRGAAAEDQRFASMQWNCKAAGDDGLFRPASLSRGAASRCR